MAVSFTTKAGTLSQLNGQLASAKIAPMVTFTVAEWRSNSAGCLKNVRSKLSDEPMIVRSSCAQEDNKNSTGAGAFLTLKFSPKPKCCPT